MDFTVKRSELLKELSLTQGIVERKTTMPILSHLLWEVADNRLNITATDLELCIHTSCEVKVKKGGVGAVPARKLLDLLRLLPDEEVGFRQLENNWVHLLSGRKTYKIVGLAADNYPKTPQPTSSQVRVPAEILSKLVERIAFAISTEESRFTPNGGLLIVKPTSISLVATDGHRLALAETAHRFAGLKKELRVLVPRKGLTELQRLAREAGDGSSVDMALDEKQLFFALDRRVLVSRLLTGQFPNYENVLRRENKNVLVLEGSVLSDALRRVAQLADPQICAVKFHLTKSGLELSASSVDYGEGKETIEKDYVGESLVIAFNAHYLLDFLGAVPDGPVSIELKDPQSAGQLRPLSDEIQCRYVVMPVRV